MPSPSDHAPHTDAEIRRWAHQRHPHEREAIPEPGERLLFREHLHGEAVPAVVDAVQDMTVMNDHWTAIGGHPAHRGGDYLPPRLGGGRIHPRLGAPDLNVWEPVLDDLGNPTGQWRMKDDPWPWVAVQVISTSEDGAETLGPPRWCKEARVRGSAGWLRPGTRAHHGRYDENGE